LTPPAVENPGMEVHIHPFQLHSVSNKASVPLYLHTSPEFCMKELLLEFNKIFTISYCFRDEPDSPIHRKQFLMLEWYRRDARYEVIMDDVEKLIAFCAPEFPPMIKKTMQELFFEILNIDILSYLDIPSIKKLLLKFPDVPVPNADLEWDDYFFLLYLNRIEPLLTKYPLLMIYEFPSPLSALSTLKISDPRVCERFEVYVNGIELCNAFNELTDSKEQRRRFSEQNTLKNKLYGYALPSPDRFYRTLSKGLPPSAGIALGIERLLHALWGVEKPFFD